MKKYILFFLILLPFGTFADRAMFDFYEKVLPQFAYEGQKPLSSLPAYQKCQEFLDMQKTYHVFEKFGFFDPKSEYAQFLYNFASSSPKRRIQSIFYPYRNPKHADQGKGTRSMCSTKESFYGGGAVKLQGYIIFSDDPIIIDKNGKKDSLDLKNAYFATTSLQDTEFSNFPFLLKEKDTYKIPLGCFEPNEENIRFLSVNTNTITNTYEVVGGIFGKKVSSLFTKSAHNPEKKITIYAYLKPNLYTHQMNIPCENSRIEKIEIIDNAGLETKPISGCLLDRKGECDPSFKLITKKDCESLGGISRTDETDKTVYTKEELQTYYFGSPCSSDERYLGHINRSERCCVATK